MFMMSKNLSKRGTNLAVSAALSPAVKHNALLTDSLKTYIIEIEHTYKVKQYAPGQQGPHASLQMKIVVCAQT